MPGLGGAGRTPAAPPRVRRNWSRLRAESNIVGGEAIQLNSDGKLVLIIATGEPLSQTASGLALDLQAAGGLSVSSSELGILFDGNSLSSDADGLRISEITEFLRTAQINSSQLVGNAYTDSVREEARAIAFFQGNM